MKTGSIIVQKQFCINISGCNLMLATGSGSNMVTIAGKSAEFFYAQKE